MVFGIDPGKAGGDRAQIGGSLIDADIRAQPGR
jgi:hypothetical protein